MDFHGNSFISFGNGTHGPMGGWTTLSSQHTFCILGDRRITPFPQLLGFTVYKENKQVQGIG
jgi:hypothetical protein